MTYRLIEFTNEKQYINMFLSLPRAVYIGDKNYMRERKSEIKNWLAGGHILSNLARQKNLIVLKEGVCVARGIAFINETGKFGSIGFFECFDEAQAVRLIVDKAKTFCKAYGIDKLYASMNGSIWGGYRIMTKGFGDKAFLGEPYNKPYYCGILTKCGFSVAKKWESQFIKNIGKGAAAERYLHIASAKKSSQLKIRGMKNYDEDIRILHKLIMNSFADFFLFQPLSEQTFVDLYRPNKRLLDKKTVKLAFNKENKPVGFGLAFPDYQSILVFLFKHAKRYVLLYYGAILEDGKPAGPLVFREVLFPVLQFVYSRKKGIISAMMSEDSKALNVTKAYDYIHEYALMQTEVD